MKVFFDLPDGFYAVKGNELYQIEPPLKKWENAKSIKIPEFDFKCPIRVHQEIICEDIQHVGYDSDQLGRDK